VEIITRGPDTPYEDGTMEMGASVDKILSETAAQYGLKRYYQRDGVNIHSKYMLVDAPYQDGNTYKRQKLVWVGTPNLTDEALYSSYELLAKIYETKLSYDVFRRNFSTLATQAATLQP